jgi:hypothetical protein
MVARLWVPQGAAVCIGVDQVTTSTAAEPPWLPLAALRGQMMVYNLLKRKNNMTRALTAADPLVAAE